MVCRALTHWSVRFTSAQQQSNLSTKVNPSTEISLGRKVTSLISPINPIGQQTNLFLHLRNGVITSLECHSSTHCVVVQTMKVKPEKFPSIQGGHFPSMATVNIFFCPSLPFYLMVFYCSTLVIELWWFYFGDSCGQNNLSKVKIDISIC